MVSRPDFLFFGDGRELLALEEVFLCYDGLGMKVFQERHFLVDHWRGVLSLVLLVLFLPVLVFVGGRVVKFFGWAAPIAANIVVKADENQGLLSRPWEGLSQGGEQERPGELVDLRSVSGQIKTLGARYIRIDHVLEEPFWERRRERIQEILDAGAIPFISLSYFPKEVSDSNTGEVADWEAWAARVRELVSLASGRNEMNVAGVYYEVWNEPDGEGFGGFSIGGGKDYYPLYKETVEAVLSVQNTNGFKVGGPALADLRRCVNGALFICQTYWLDRFLELVVRDKVRLDFISWHRYSLRLADYKEDVNFVLSLLNKYDAIGHLEKVISEWGSEPARSSVHSSVFDAAHLVAGARTFIGFVDLATKFEIRDGPDPDEGGWGIVDHNGEKKPTFAALQLLGLLRRDRVLLTGEGSYVSGVASRDNSGVTVILANFDRAGGNTERVPIEISGMSVGRYRLTKHVIDSLSSLGRVVSFEVTSDGSYQTQETMLPNSVVLFDWQLVGLH